MLAHLASSSLALHLASLVRPLPRARSRPPAMQGSEELTPLALSLRVREALIYEEEREFLVGGSNDGGPPRPLKINLDLLTHRARVLERRGDLQGARETFEHCTQIDPRDGRAWLALSRSSGRAGRPDEAERLLKRGLSYEPRSPHLLQAYGSLLERRGRQDEALELYTAALGSRPSHAPSWVACGLLLERRRELAAAGSCLRTASAVAPGSYFVWQVIGEWHKRRGRLGSAREAFRRSLALNSRNAATYHSWAVLEWRCGHQALATKLFDRGLETSPHNRYLLQSFATMQAKAGNSAEANRLFSRALARKGAADGATWQARAMQHIAEGRRSEARRCFRRGVKCEPSHVPLWHAWGAMEAESNATAAAGCYQKGVWASRDDRATASLWTAWALLEEREGNVPRAREFLRRAAVRDRFAVDVRVAWAGVEARAGDTGAARALLEVAVRIDPANAEAWTAYEEVERAAGRAAAADRVYARSVEKLAVAPEAAPEPRGWGRQRAGSESGSVPRKALQKASIAAKVWVRSVQRRERARGVETEYGREQEAN